MEMEQGVLKRRHMKFRRRGVTQKKTYNNGYGVIPYSELGYTVSHNSGTYFLSERCRLLRPVCSFIFKTAGDK